MGDDAYRRQPTLIKQLENENVEKISTRGAFSFVITEQKKAFG
jgi:hypothetical protein